jgi:alpha-ketoglutarate-dependent taurine dioxygenase
VKSDFLDGDGKMPLLVEPTGAREASPDALIAWAEENRSLLDTWLHRDGAILLRGFGIDTPDGFRAVAAAVRPELMNYVGGDSPRSRVGDRVYTSTEFPPDMEIGLHNELSYTRSWPSCVFFCCLVAAERGGETHIADGRRILAELDPVVRERFSTRGVIYRQHLRDAGVSGPGKSWQESFETDRRAEVERVCGDQEMECHWTDRGLRTVVRNPGVLIHPVTDETCWFNQADMWHATFDTVKAQEDVGEDDVRGKEPLGCHATYGDGSEIPSADLEAVRSACGRSEVAFPWRAGDLLILDNVLTMHGRKPFEGARRVLVAMA